MDEQGWLHSLDISALLNFAARHTSIRKLRLFGCACCRQAVVQRDAELLDQATSFAELLADEGLASADVSPDQVAEVRERIRRQHLPLGGPARLGQTGPWFAVLALLDDFSSFNLATILSRITNVSDYTRLRDLGSKGTRKDANRVEHHVAYLRDIAGNPFRPVPIRPEWLVWQHGQIPRFARQLYDESRFAELPYLADALEDAGCSDESILTHLREPGVHAKGCWVVDSLIGMW